MPPWARCAASCVTSSATISRRALSSMFDPKGSRGVSSMCSLDGKVAVVTGASRGLGRAIARELHRHGAFVVIHYYQSRQLAEELVEELNAGDRRRAMCVQAGVAHAAEDPE